MGIMDDYFDGYYAEEMIECQVVMFSCFLFVIQLFFGNFVENLCAQMCFSRWTNKFLKTWCVKDSPNWVCIFSKLYKLIIDFSFLPLLNDIILAVHHLDYLGVQVAWVTGPWFLSIFMNMLPWESGQVPYIS